MPYTFSDANKKSWAGPTISTLREIKNLIKEFKAPRPALSQLLTYGYTPLLPALSMECNNLANKTKDKDIKSSLTHLAAVARQANEIVILES